MSNKELESNVIQSIYGTATDENRWRETLDLCSKFVGAKSAGLVVTDENDNSPYEDRYLSSLYHSVDPEKLQYYRDHLRKYEHIAWDMLKALPPMTIVSDDEFREQVAQQDDFVFFREVLGVDRRMVSRINDHRAWFDALAFQFDLNLQARPTNCETQFRILLPHLANALQIGRCFWQLQRHYRMVLGALSHVKMAMCVASEGKIAVFNQEADNIFQMDDGISLSKNKEVRFRSKDIQARFNFDLEELSKTSRGEGDVCVSHFLIERPSGKESFLIDVSPLRDVMGEIAKDLSGALVSIIDPTNTREYDFRRFSSLYELTSAEAEITKLIVGGSSNQEISEIRNVSEQTTKNQTHRIYQKTETNSRASLMRKIAMTTPPIVLG